MAGSALAAFAYAVPATAQAQGAINIPAQPLSSALLALSRQTGLEIFFDSAATAGKNSQGASGAATPVAALRQVLAGSGLQYSFTNANTVTVGSPSAAAAASGLGGDGEIVLDTIDVTTTNKATTEGTGSYTTESMSSSTGLNLSIKETPQSVTVQSRQRLDDQNLQEIKDVARQTVGLHMNETGSQGSDSNSIYARGFEVNNFQADGIGQSNLYRGADEIADTAVYDRVEVVRGASGLMNGTGDPSASINLFRKKPTAETHFSGLAQLGSWDRYRGEVDFSGPLNEAGTVRGRFVGAFQDQDSFIDRLEMRKGVLYGVLEADLSDSTMLTFGLEYQRHEAEDASRSGHPLLFADGSHANLPRSTNSATDWADTESEKLAVFGSLEHEFDNGWLVKLDLDHTYRNYDEIIGYAIRGSLNPDGTGMGIWPGRWSGDPTQTSAKLEASGTFDLFGREHDLVFGLTGFNAVETGPTYLLWSSVPGWDTPIPNYFDWDGSFPAVTPDDIARTGDFENKQSQVSGYAAMRLRPSDDLSLIFGGRMTNWRQSRYSTPFGGPETGSSQSGTAEFTPYAGVVYDLTDVFSVYASYASIFKPQTYKDSSGAYLAPLVGNAYEAGVKASFNEDRLNATFALFRIEQDNYAISDESTPADPTDYIAVPGTVSEGFEIEVAGELMEGWQVGGGFSYADVVDYKGDELLPYIPSKMFKLFTTYRLPGAWDKLTVGGSVYWQGDIEWASGTRRFEQGDFALLDLMARYEFTENVSLTLNVNNVFDERYYTSINSGNGYFGEPRSALLTLRSTW